MFIIRGNPTIIIGKLGEKVRLRLFASFTTKTKQQVFLADVGDDRSKAPKHVAWDLNRAVYHKLATVKPSVALTLRHEAANSVEN